MDSVWNVTSLAVAIAAGIFVASLLGQRLYVRALLKRLRFGFPASERIGRQDIPEDIRLILDDGARRIAALGFEYAYSGCAQPAVRSHDRAPVYSDVYFHPGARCFATVEPADMPEPGAAVAVTFWTALADGRTLATVNRRLHQFLPMPPDYLLDDGYLPGVAEQWELHRRRAAAEAGDVVDDHAESWRRRERTAREMIDLWVSAGLMQSAGEDLLKLTPAGVRAYFRNAATGNRRLAALPPPSDTDSREALVAADLHGYRASQSLAGKGAFGRVGKLVLFAVSTVVGAVAFGLAFSWQIVPVLLGLLLFHEFGHALAMRATGYRNVQVLVIPFLGAVASGRKDDAGPWTRLLVLLAGPLPGLVLAVFCLHSATGATGSHPLLLQIGVVALVLNLFNLLPITPLDGGQIVETFLFSRWPRLRLLFFLGSLVALGVLGLWLHSEVLLGLALLLAIGTRGLRRSYLLAGRIGPVGLDEAPRAILEALHAMPPRLRGTFRHRVQTVRALSPLLAARPPRGWESALGLAIYLAAIGAPLALLHDVAPARRALAAVFSAPPGEAQVERNWDRELAEAGSGPERWLILMEAGAWEEDMEDYDAAHRRYQEAAAIARGFTAGDLRLLDSRIALIRTGDWDRALPRYRELLDELRALQGKERVRLAVVLEQMYWLESDSPSPPTGRLREAVDVRAAFEPSSHEIAADRREIARVLYRQGKTAEAETELRLALAASPGPHQAEALIWLLIDRGRGAEAQALIRQYLPGAGYASRDLRQALAWALLAEEQGSAARRELEAQLKEAKPGAHFLRLSILLDLIHACADAPGPRERWRDLARAEIRLLQRDDSLVRTLGFRDEFSPWLARRTQARLAAIESLDAPPASVAKQGPGDGAPRR